MHILATATAADLHAWRSHLNNMTSYFRNFFPTSTLLHESLATLKISTLDKTVLD